MHVRKRQASLRRPHEHGLDLSEQSIALEPSIGVRTLDAGGVNYRARSTLSTAEAAAQRAFDSRPLSIEFAARIADRLINVKPVI